MLKKEKIKQLFNLAPNSKSTVEGLLC